MNEQQIENLASQVVCRGASVTVRKEHLGVISTICEFNLNDAIEETSHEHYAQEVLRGFANSKPLYLKSYQEDLIEYTSERINTWVNDGYTVEVKQ